jgi:hypothetical protein
MVPRIKPECGAWICGMPRDGVVRVRGGHHNFSYRANESDVNAPAVGGALKLAWLKPHHAKPLLGDNDPQGECSAGQVLAIRAVTGVDRLRLLGYWLLAGLECS